MVTERARLNRSAHIASENIIEVLLVDQIVLLFPLWPPLRPVVRGATSHPFIDRAGRSDTGANARRPNVFHHQFKFRVPVIVVFFIG